MSISGKQILALASKIGAVEQCSFRLARFRAYDLLSALNRKATLTDLIDQVADTQSQHRFARPFRPVTTGISLAAASRGFIPSIMKRTPSSMKPLSYFLDTPTVGKLQQRYGSGLRSLPVTTRLGILKALSSAAHALATVGVSESLDMLFAETVADTEESPEQELYALLSQLDKELTDPAQLSALVAGISEGLAFHSA